MEALCPPLIDAPALNSTVACQVSCQLVEKKIKSKEKEILLTSRLKLDKSCDFYPEMPEGEKIWGCQQYRVGRICPPPVELGLTDPPKSVAPCASVPASLLLFSATPVAIDEISYKLMIGSFRFGQKERGSKSQILTCTSFPFFIFLTKRSDKKTIFHWY